jgi:F-type H+-transporting ATPase subunit gamma
MSSPKEVRSKIKSVESTKKITGAMELVAASKMKKSQGIMQANRPYAAKIRAIVSDLLTAKLEETHPFLIKREVKKVAYIVISSKRGLCGGLNTNLFRAVLKDMRLKKENNIEPLSCLVGAKAISFFKKIDTQSIALLDPVLEKPSMEELIGLIGVGLRAFENKDIDALYLCYNMFQSSLTQQPTIEQLLPLSFNDQGSIKKTSYLYEEESPSVMVDMILIRYIEAIIYQAILENFTSEQAARMVAMKSATDNATTLIDDLTLVYNKARQAAITREITEIVSGAAALK